MAEEIICGIYKITNLINGKMYVGQSVDIDKRWREHKRELNLNHHYNRYLQKSWNKYKAENFEFSILEVVKRCKGDLNEREIYWIDNLSTFQPAGYNLSLGGEGNLGLKHTQASKDKISKIQMGRKLTPEWKRNISISHKGITPKNIQIFLDMNEASKVNICQYSLDDIFIKEWTDGIQECSRIMGIEATNLVKVLKGKHQTCGGFIWKYSDEDYEPVEKNWVPSDKKVLQFNLKMELLKTWDNMQTISDDMDILVTNIYKCCLDTISMSHNYIWIYEEDYKNGKCRKPLSLPKQVIQYSKDNEIIKIWDSTKEAADFFKIRYQNIGAVCRGKEKTAHGFKWGYVA